MSRAQRPRRCAKSVSARCTPSTRWAARSARSSARPYVILPALGVDGTVFAAAGGSALIGGLALLFGNARASAPSAPCPKSSHRASTSPLARKRAPLFFLAFASRGSLVFAAEEWVFTHLLALIIGNSAYAFGLILAAFLSCLFVGASRASFAQRRFGDASLPFGLALSGLGLALTLPAWDKLPYFFDNTGEVLTSFTAREATRGVAAFVMLVVPTTLMGLTFPLLLQRGGALRARGKLGRAAHGRQHARRRARLALDRLSDLALARLAAIALGHRVDLRAVFPARLRLGQSLCAKGRVRRRGRHSALSLR